jgi:cell division transport system permease protein
VNRLRLVLAESLRSLGANLSTTLAATITVLIGMFLLGLFVAFGTLVVSWSDHVKRELQVKVFFNQDASAKQINAVRIKLQSDPHVRDVTFVSKEEALQRMEKRFPDLFKTRLPSNPLPPAFEVQPKKGEFVDAIYQSLGGRHPNMPGVNEVKDGKRTSHKILQVAHVIEAAFIIAVVLLVIASTLLIANTIRLSIFSRRREIEVMKLVGATNWFVRGPFMLEGLICGAIGAVGAILLLLLGKELVLPSIPALQGAKAGPDVRALAFELNALLLVGGGLLLGAAGSGLTLRRFLRV